MPLFDINLPPIDGSLPPDVRRFIREADRRVARFQSDCRVPGFVPCAYAGAFGVLRWLSGTATARGRRFCEWGSGFGVVAGLAAMLDYDACGIEVEGELVHEAVRLADDFSLPVEFAHGSFIPRGAEDRVHAGGTYSWLTTEAGDAYAELGLDPSDMDVVFAYPWPDEEGVIGELFERYAGPGAVLATYHGGHDFRLRRKVGRRGRRGGRGP
jgi:hypothetical protein